MSADEFKQKGNDAFRQKNFPEAIDYFTEAIKASETPNHVLYSNRSACYASLHKYDEALHDAKECVKINPTWAKGYNRVGAAEFGLSNYDSSIEAYNNALKLEPTNSMAKEGIESANSAKSSSPDAGVNDMFSKFTDPQLINKLKVNPKTADLMKDPVLVEKVRKMQSDPQAVAADMMSDPRLMTIVTTILGIDLSQPPNGGANDVPIPTDDDIKMEDATPIEKPASNPTPKTTQKADESKAEPSTSNVSESSDKEEADKFKGEANKLYKSKKFDEAIALYNKAWETYKDITYLNNRAAAEFEKGDYDAAIKTCEDAIEEGRDMRANYTLIAKSFARIGNCYLKKDDLKKAISYFEKSLTEHRTADTLTKLRNAEQELKKRESESYINKDLAEEARLQGKEYFTKGDWPNAVKAYTEMIKRDPTDVRGYSNRAAALSKLMSFPDSIRDCDKAIKIDPTFIKAYIRKATSQMAMKEYKGSIDTLYDAKDIETKNGNNPTQLREIETMLQKALSQRFAPLEGETYDQSVARFQKDPEVVEILQDPVMNTILQQAQGNPAALQEHMKNPEVYKKILILMAAGIIRTR
ncbi:Hsp90 cochaperone [Pichia californica]|uniref:Hsp90 cochaperone n=1 Tax=Pichia californica TaxID=460514 RepID=A0A9P7BE33_9ASCO|nr:Hsp90 cochaperone [[Candida] californica]KAG0688847.1 Hsp90 cochaperone [[Candida] californica]